MRQFTLLTAVILLVASALYLTSCDSRKPHYAENLTAVPYPDPFDVPADSANWVLAFTNYSDSTANYIVEAFPTNLTNYSPDANATAEIILGSDHNYFTWHDLPGFPHEWSTVVYMVPGQTYRATFKLSGRTVISTNIKAVYQPVVSFPTSYDPRLPDTLNWTLETDNQYQFAGVILYQNVEGGTGYLDGSWELLNPSLRTYTVPANAVDTTYIGMPGYYYHLDLVQINYKTVNHIAVMVLNPNVRNYNTIHPALAKANPAYLRSIYQAIRRNSAALK